MPREEIIAMRERLVAHGWREMPDRLTHATASYFKRFPTQTLCCCNNDKPGIQLVVRLYEHSEPHRIGYEIEISGEVVDGSWYSFKRYGFPEELRYGLACIPQMLFVWEAAAVAALDTPPPAQEADDEQ